MRPHRWFAQTSQVLVLAAALFALLNAVAAFSTASRPAASVSTWHPAFDERNLSAFEALYHRPISEVREIVRESWDDDAWIYEPFVQFRERPRSGRFVNVSSQGFRLNSTEPSPAPPDETTPLAYLLGGSTAFGYGVADDETIAAYLEGLLARESANTQVRVLNFGRGYYGSSQEVLLLRSLVQRDLKPRVVIFFDGINEAFCPYYSNNLAEVFAILSHDPLAAARAAATALPVVRLLRRSEEPLAANALRAPRPGFGRRFECEPGDDPALRRLAQAYAMNREMARAIGRSYGIDMHFVLQPTAGLFNDYTRTPWGQPIEGDGALIEALEPVFAESSSDTHSLVRLLEAYPEPAFVDDCHYTPEANREIARALLPIALPALAPHLSKPPS